MKTLATTLGILGILILNIYGGYRIGFRNGAQDAIQNQEIYLMTAFDKDSTEVILINYKGNIYEHQWEP